MNLCQFRLLITLLGVVCSRIDEIILSFSSLVKKTDSPLEPRTTYPARFISFNFAMLLLSLSNATSSFLNGVVIGTIISFNIFILTFYNILFSSAEETLECRLYMNRATEITDRVEPTYFTVALGTLRRDNRLLGSSPIVIFLVGCLVAIKYVRTIRQQSPRLISLKLKVFT